jgi:cell division control protein 45
MGGILDLPSSEWFGDFRLEISVHIIDSARPQNLSSLFGGGENGERIVVWDDGGAEKLSEERKAWEALMVRSSICSFISLLTGLIITVRA